MLTKAEIRAAAKARRARCDPALGAQLAAHILRDGPPPAGAIIAGFWPLPGEIDIRPLLNILAQRGHALALPETPPRGQALTFRRYTPGSALLPGRFGTVHPAGEIIAPDVILVPLLAFDAAGNRLGYGGGYYDRTFAAHPAAFRLGCAFAVQEIPSVPTEPHDAKLHAIATEAGIQKF
jgi:5-formyltetrahydrofolate cyclo-ligase